MFVVATTEQIDKAKDIVKKLKFNFNSEAFENPGTTILLLWITYAVHIMCLWHAIPSVLQKHYQTLEALALEHEVVEEIEDFSKPDLDMINNRVGSVIEAFKQVVFPDGYTPGAKPTKRKVTS